MARDSSREEIELAVMTTGMAMVAAGVGTGERERAREGARRLWRVCSPQVVL
jgi:hypothetical protein